MWTPCALLLSASLLTASPPLTTHAERTGFLETGRYEEVEKLCHSFSERYPQQVRCERFGITPEGRPMLALVASKAGAGALDARSARSRRLPVVLFQGGIHAGEIDGKDAGFLLLRELLENGTADNPLRKVVAVFVPVFNVDGHERFGPNHRPNQIGPKEMGWRVTAQNLNLNRDYAKAESPEMQAMLGLLGKWDPILYLDLHVTDGAKFEHDVALMMEPLHAGDEGLRTLGQKMQAAVMHVLSESGHLPLSFYPSFEEDDSPASGFARGVAPPRFSQGYWSLKNRFGVLVETHSWRPYPHRVKTTRNVLDAYLRQTARDGAAWLETAKAADARDVAAAERELPLQYQASKKAESLDYRGYAYRKVMSELSGQEWIQYDDTKPEIWKVPYRKEVLPSVVVATPSSKGGYVVPAAWAGLVAEKLKVHGLRYETLAAPTTVEAQAFRAQKKTFSAAPSEGRQTLVIEGEWRPERREVAKGSLFVPVAQRGRRLVLQLFEPRGRDALVAWGYFNAAFEQKEYIEDYVLEGAAREMMAKDPALAAEFQRRVAEDPAFAKDPKARLRFFAVRHPAWDERLDLYPVLKVDARPGR